MGVSSLAEYARLDPDALIDTPAGGMQRVAAVRELGRKSVPPSLVPPAVEPARVALIGPSRCGKAEVRERLSRLWRQPAEFGSSSWYATSFVCSALAVSREQFYEQRHQYRAFLYHFCKGIRDVDATLLVRLSLEKHRIAAGMRDKAELSACRKAGLLPLVIWIDREVPSDPTLELTEDDADLVLNNHGSLLDLDRRVDALGRSLA